MSPVTQTEREEVNPGFNTEAIFSNSVNSGSVRVFSVRWPTDKEWCDNSKRKKFSERSVGQYTSEFDDSGNELSDSALFEAIRLDKDGPPWGPFEAAAAIEKIKRSRIKSSAFSGDAYRIELVAHKCPTVHQIRMPTLDRIGRFGKSSVRMYRVTNGRQTQTDLIEFIEHYGPLYDEHVESVEGYVSAVPIIHKYAIMTEVIRLMRVEEDAEDF